jgi:ribosomal RNA-processing protein 8
MNERFYRTDSTEAHQLLKSDPNVFEEVSSFRPLEVSSDAEFVEQYHTGFRYQVEAWPSNPVSHYISTLSTRQRGTVIADLGCGDAGLARALIPKGVTVLSFDLVSDGVFVVEADICGRLPLPGSEGLGLAGEKEDGDGSVVDVAICALSLMGTNWPQCIRETWRILKPGYVTCSIMTENIGI